MKKIFTLAILSLLIFNSCYVNRTTVGDGPTRKHGSARYDKAKQFYLFWGAIAVGKGQPNTPTECGYQIRSSFNFWDGLISTITGGILGTRTVRVLVRKNSPCDPAVQRLENKAEKAKLKREIKDVQPQFEN